MTRRLDGALAACGLALVVVAVPLAVRPPAVTVVSATLTATATASASRPAAAVPTDPVPDEDVDAPETSPVAGGGGPPVVVVGEPRTLVVPALDLSADVVPVLTTASGALDLPADPRVLGWWAAGARPGAAQGSAVLAAHVDARGVGAGPMSSLLRAPLGTTLDVTDTSGTTRAYRLVERRSVRKAALPADVFDAGGPPRLVLVTCGGPFDEVTGHYRDNVVLVATPAA